MEPIEIDGFGFGSGDEVTEHSESQLNIELIKRVADFSLISNHWVIELEHEFSRELQICSKFIMLPPMD
ncbi:hypothetical protein ACET3Z_000609 [Daucus carota]